MKLKLKKLYQPKYLLLAILLTTAFLRLYRLDYPNQYVFDEVYHAYTAKEYLKGNKDAWSPWGKSEPGVAFEWLHPPIEKELMTTSMFILRNTDAWAYRLPGALLGILSVFLVFKLALLLFKNEAVGLGSALVFSVDGLVFVQSRTGMNDVYLVAFILISVIFFVQQRYLFSALFMGIALATKWPGIFLAAMYFPILFYKRQFKSLIYFVLIPPAIYLLSYVPYFLIGYRWNDFIELHRQIWWYQTHLKATHNYASPWWSWPLNLYPIWYFVDYKGENIANIFSSGNPVVFWGGGVAILLTAWGVFQEITKNLWRFFVKKGFDLITIVNYLTDALNKPISIVLLGYFIFWLPWAISPRIMFLYHFSPSVPFLSMALGYQLHKIYQHRQGKKLVIMILSMMVIGFIIIFPFLTGIPIPKQYVNLFFITNITRNPFQ